MKKGKIILSNVTVGLLVASCAQMPQKKEAEYVPEVRKEISFTYESNTAKEVKDGLNLVISKADLMDDTYKVNECGAQAPVAEQPTKEVAKPAPAAGGMGALFGGLGALASAATGAATGAVNPAAPTQQAGANQQYKVVERKFLPSNAVVFKVDLKSEINHVLSFEKAYFLLRDPKGQIHKAKAITADQNWAYTNWCATKEQSSAYFDRMNAVRDLQSALVFPKDTYTAYVAFYPQTRDIPGDWKLLMYELPVATTNAGIPSVTDHFYSKGVVKKWETTFKKMTPAGQFEKVETKEVL